MQATEERKPMRTVWIYGLIDPREPDRIRYVGKTLNPVGRLQTHLRGPRPPKLRRWIGKVRAEGFAPEMKLLQEANERSADCIEFDWIARLKGNHLFNTLRRSYTTLRLRPGVNYDSTAPLTVPVTVKPPRADWACLEGIDDSLWLAAIEAERQYQARKTL